MKCIKCGGQVDSHGVCKKCGNIDYVTKGSMTYDNLVDNQNRPDYRQRERSYIANPPIKVVIFAILLMIFYAVNSIITYIFYYVESNPVHTTLYALDKSFPALLGNFSMILGFIMIIILVYIIKLRRWAVKTIIIMTFVQLFLMLGSQNFLGMIIVSVLTFIMFFRDFNKFS